MKYLKKFESSKNKLDFDTFKELMYDITDDLKVNFNFGERCEPKYNFGENRYLY